MSLVYTSYGRAAVLQEYEGLRPRRFDMVSRAGACRIRKIWSET
jgi:hypothetical protein